MEAFSSLLNQLIFTRGRNEKLNIIAEYLLSTPDPDRGWALAALTNSLSFPAVKSGTVRQLISLRTDPVLFALSRDYVGDTAETVSLLWPTSSPDCDALSLSDAVDLLGSLNRNTVTEGLSSLLDRLDENGRFALLKLATGGLRAGVSARMARLAFAKAFQVDVNDVEEFWHALAPPYTKLFDWAEGRSPPPNLASLPVFRPFMLASPLEERTINLEDYAVEWKWDGIRVQVVHVEGQTRLYSRGGDDITASFPEIAGALNVSCVLDGELLVRGSVQGGEEGGAASFNALQQRLGRKSVSKKHLEEFPAFVRVYDILFDGALDLRPMGWSARRSALEHLMPRLPHGCFDLSSLIEAEDFDQLVQLRDDARDAAIEGLMFKRRDSAYTAGRKVGHWYKWKRDPLRADCVLMYAQRGSGKRSSFYSDFTFGCWTGPPDNGGELVPVGKAYSGFTDDEMKWLDKFIRRHTVGRFGPVREVEKSLVLEVAFDSVHLSNRHKSGVAMRFPRIARIRNDKPAAEADFVANLAALAT